MCIRDSFLASLIAVFASRLFPVTLTLTVEAADLSAPQGIVEVFRTLLLNIVANPVSAIINANYIGILSWAVLFGIGLRGANDNTKKFFDDVSTGLSKVVTWIISFAPFGILGLVYSAVSTNGLGIFTEYGRLLAVLVGSMLFLSLIHIFALNCFTSVKKLSAINFARSGSPGNRTVSAISPSSAAMCGVGTFGFAIIFFSFT